MKKRLSALVLALLMLCLPAAAHTDNQQNTADALNHMNLFLGKGGTLGYDLDAKLNRNQGVILLVRMLGKEDEAQEGNYRQPFLDVPAGASPHVAYAYANGIVNGYTATAFGGSDTMTDKMFLALSLRALGYTDKGDNKDFEYSESRQMAYKVGLVSDPAYDSEFTRGEAVEVFWKILHTKFKGETQTLGDRLIQQGVITKAQLEKAEDIQKNGKKTETPSTGGASGGGSSAVGGGSSSGGTSSGSSGNTAAGELTWEAYEALTVEQKQAYFLSFADPMDFFTWQTAAKAAYDAAHPAIDVGSGSVDLGELLGKGTA